MPSKHIYQRLLSETKLSDNQLEKLHKGIVSGIINKYDAFLFRKKFSINKKIGFLGGILLLRFKDSSDQHDVIKHLSLAVRDLNEPLVNQKQLFYSKKLRLAVYRISFEFLITDIADKGIHHAITVKYDLPQDIDVRKRIWYSFFNQNKHPSKKYGNHGPILGYGKKMSAYLRQSNKNELYITIRDKKITDRKKEQLKLAMCRFLSRFLRLVWKPTIMYEKHGSRFEESASHVFDKLIKKGKKRVYYVLPADNKKYAELKNKYKSKLLLRHSFKHYLAFFCSDTFIGTEAPVHAIDLRAANKHIVRKISDENNRCIFLQHGVMYMVALSSKSRYFARKGGGVWPDSTKVVVSSIKEAEHFIVHGNYSAEDLYLTGLPKFDTSTRKKNADKIVIMPTWRPWDFNAMRTNPEETGYYKMMVSMFNAIPKELKEKVIMLPHPLFAGSLTNTKLGKYVVTDKPYNDILEETDLLVTDYSSIAYDAFYRGSNVAFWWGDKDYCMEMYRGSLMLNEDNAFGDISYTEEDLSRSVKKRYGSKQPKNYRKHYDGIIEFSDNNNTDRLIRLLEQEQLVS